MTLIPQPSNTVTNYKQDDLWIGKLLEAQQNHTATSCKQNDAAMPQKSSTTTITDKQKLRNHLIYSFKKLNGYPYQITEKNQKVVDTILAYFAKVPHFYDLLPNGSFKKGLLVLGGYGTGKTSLFEAIHHCQLHSPNGFGIASALDLMKAYGRNSYDGIHSQISGNWLFDDVGEEHIVSHYGNKENVVKLLLSERYRQRKKPITHITTNLSLKMLKEKYGQRIYERFYEMFNVLVLDGRNYRKNPTQTTRSEDTAIPITNTTVATAISIKEKHAINFAFTRFLQGEGNLYIPKWNLYNYFAKTIGCYNTNGQFPYKSIKQKAIQIFIRQHYQTLENPFNSKQEFEKMQQEHAQAIRKIGGELSLDWLFNFWKEQGATIIFKDI